MSGKKLSVVIPVYNEERAFSHNFPVILQHLDNLSALSVEIIIVDDGSKDRTASIVQEICNKRTDAQLLRFTRNFGKEAAIHAGLDNASGDAVIVMDSDLQHPPELIARMVDLWQGGNDIVEAYKLTRGNESLLSRIFANGFYRIFGSLSGMDLSNHTDYKLLDRKVVEAYKALPEHARFFRGIIKWLGYTAVQIPFDVPEREHGASAWSRLRLARFSIQAITAFSAAPLHFVTLLGGLTLMISLIFGSIALYGKLSGQALSGFTTVILLLLIIGSILMLSLGLIGIYIQRIYEETKGRPNYIIKK